MDATRWAGALVIARDGYPAGVPCWIDLEPPDVGAAIEFYGGVFGWTFDDRQPAEARSRSGSADRDVVAALDGLTVAGVGSPADETAAGATGPPRWNTYVAVDDADGVAATVWRSGGRVLQPPTDVGTAGRSAVIADPAGAALRLWQAATHRGAQVVNADSAWNWSNLVVADPSAVGDFYRAVFGWELTAVDIGGAEALMVRRPGYGDHLAELEPGIRERQDESGAPPGFADAVAWVEQAPAGTPATWRIVFAVADTDATARRAVELGGAGARRAVRRRPRSSRRAGRRSGRRVHGEPLRPIAALSVLRRSHDLSVEHVAAAGQVLSDQPPVADGGGSSNSS